MKILIFTTPFYPKKSGLGDYVLRLSKKLSQLGNHVTILCYDTENTNKFEDIVENIKLFRIKDRKILGVYFLPYKKYLYKKLDELSKEKFDLVITNTRFFHSSLIGMKFAKKHNIPLIHVEHGTSFVQTNNPIIWIGSRMFDLTFGKKILNKADKIIAISEDVKRFVKKLSNKDAVIIYNGIELNNIQKKKKQSKEMNKLIFVGRLIYAKGIQDLIMAFSKIDNKNLILTIVGDGPYKSELEDLVKKSNLTDKIIFTGEKTKQEVLNLLAESDLFINPSYSEGLPTSVLEAGAVGLPVIATDVGGTSEVIINNETGLLIKKENPLQIKEAIEFMLNNKKRRDDFSRNLNQLVKDKFNWEVIAEQWKKLVE